MKNVKKIMGLFALMILVFAVSVTSVAASGPLTVVSGTVTDMANDTINGADVQVTCTHNAVDTIKDVVTGTDGIYYAYFDPTECDEGDAVTADVSYDGQTGEGDGQVTYTGHCLVNVAIIDVQIPEFGVVAAGLALVGAIAGFAVMRRKD